MRYLTTYQIFEAENFNKEEIDKMGIELSDCLLDIFDKYGIIYSENDQNNISYWSYLPEIYKNSSFVSSREYVNSSIIIHIDKYKYDKDKFKEIMSDISDIKSSIEGRIGCNIKIYSSIAGKISDTHYIRIEIKWQNKLKKFFGAYSSGSGDTGAR